MPTAEARVTTARASRYLVQLCRHLSQMRSMRHRPPTAHSGGQLPPEIQDVDYSDTYGTITFANGQCTLAATPQTLTLRVEAEDEETLERLQKGIGGRIEKIGRRDQLTVAWQRSTASNGPVGKAPDQAALPEQGAGKRRGLGKAMTLGSVGIVVVALHLGLGGAALAGSSWTEWGANAILAVVALKLLFMTSHVVLGRLGIRAIRHSRRPIAPPRPDAPDNSPHAPTILAVRTPRRRRPTARWRR